MKKFYALTNLLVIVAVIVWNYVANAVGINGNSVASVSDRYFNLFTPAGYAFSIWGLIYLGLLAHGIFQVKRAFFDRKDDDFILRIGPWLIIANLANAAWIWFWLNENTGISVLMILAMLVSLLVIVVRLQMERRDAPVPLIIWTRWPISLYSGWITVATIANIAAYLVKIGWEALFTDITWTVIMIVVATIINLLMILLRNMKVYAAVGVWAIVAIAVRHWGELPLLQWTALGCAILLFLVISVQAIRNRSRNPLIRKEAAQ
jgi:hypothetical protein